MKFSIMFCKLMIVPIMQPNKPNKNISRFFTPFQLYGPKLFQFAAVSIMAGAMRLSVDILTEPSKATKRSSHGTVAANKTII